LTWPLTGRSEEMRVIQAALSAPDTSGMVVHGAAGVGKSRIARDALVSAASTKCTYSSEGFDTTSFGLPADGFFDLFVAAVRLFKNRTGTVTCDNGTSTNTSVFY